VGNIAPDADFQAVIETYADEIRRCRFGSFRGVIKDGKIVIFAIEQEWRPQLNDGMQRIHQEEAS
jgi:hypothetical protein